MRDGRKTWIVKFENGSMVQMFATNYDDLQTAIETWGKYFSRDQSENPLTVIEVRRC